MKRTILSISAVLLLSAVCQAETIKASDSRISYIGRVETVNETVRFDWSATTLRVRFTGTTLVLDCSDTKHDYFNVWIDKAQCARADKVFDAAGDTLITVFKGRKGTHEVIIQKRTEAEQGCFTLNGITTDGKFLEAPAQKSRVIEFIGDSYTCGYGTEGEHRSDPFLASTENPSLTYADILGRAYGAEAIHISHSGRGIVRNWGDYNQHENMVKLYGQTFDQYNETAWTPTYTPDLVVIYLGTNDFSVGKQPSLQSFCDGYKALLNKVREFHGENVPILCLASPANELMDYYVEEAVSRCGLGGVHFASILPGAHENTDKDLGSSWHPNYNGHRKVASIAAPFISTITGWDLPFVVYE